MKLGEDGLDDFFMPRLRSADEIVVGEFQLDSEGLPACRELITIGLRSLALGDGRLLDLLSMFIQSGEVVRLVPQTALKPREDIGDDLFVSVAKVRLTIDIIYRRRDIKALAHPRLLWPPKAILASSGRHAGLS